MAALSDPRAFMGAAKERTDNMKQLGIEESGPEKKVTIEEKKEGKLWRRRTYMKYIHGSSQGEDGQHELSGHRGERSCEGHHRGKEGR